MKWICLGQNHGKPIPDRIGAVVKPIQDGIFRGCSRMGGGAKKTPPPKICHTYPTMIKLGRFIPYPKKIQKIHESRDTLREFY